jgi:hypothetical protein
VSMRPLFDDPGSAVPDYETLRVDIAALADLASALRKEIDGNLLPHVGPLAGAYGMGVKFGLMSHSQNMKLARKTFHDCLVGATESLANRITAGESLAAAVEQIAKLYGGSDAMASARSEEVADIIDSALAATPLRDVTPVIEQFSGRAGSFR